MGKALELGESLRISIARSLFEVKEQQEGKGELHGLCPFHGEKNPSFSYNYRKDVYHCLTGCSGDGDLITLWARVKGYTDPKEAFKAFCREYGMEVGGRDGMLPPVGGEERVAPGEALPPLCDVYAKFPPLPEEWIARLIERRGWTREGIEAAGLRLQTYYRRKKDGELVVVKRPERIAIPIFDEGGKVRNIRLYKPGAQEMKIISWASDYGGARLYPARPLPDGVVLLVEGESDRICAMCHGFNAITQTTKPKKWSKDHLAKFTDRDVVIAYDADQAGQKYALEFAAPELKKVARSVRILEWPDNMGRRSDGLWPEDHGEDLTDFFVKHKGTAEELQALVDLANPFTQLTEEEVLGCALEFFERGPNDRVSFKPRLLADRILKDKRLLYVPKMGVLYTWNGMHWEMYDEELLKEYAIRLLSSESQKSRAEDAVFQVKMLSTIPHGREPNDKKDWLCIKNGMFNPVTLELRPFDPGYYCTFQMPVAYSPTHHKKPELWLRFLDQTLAAAGPINQAQEFFGYCLLQKTLYGRSLICWGPGEDGKSVFLKVLQSMVGEDNSASVAFKDLEDQNYRASLYGKALNVSTEIGREVLQSTYFKAITTGDPISAAFKYQSPFTFKPYVKQAFATNDLPPVMDNTHGYYRRLLILKFVRQFKEGDPDRDPNLEEKLKENLTGIFHWALAGLHRLMAQGYFSNCDEHIENIHEYKRLNDAVLCFVEDCLEIGEGYETEKKDVYTNYKNYCTANGSAPKKRERFWRDMHTVIKDLKMYRPSRNGERPWVVEGVRLKPIGMDTAA